MLNINFHLLVTASLFILGLNYVTDYESNNETIYVRRVAVTKTVFKYRNPLWFLRSMSIYLFGTYLAKPLFTCVICMASVWGSAFYFICSTNINLIEWVVFIVALAGLNRFLSNFL